MYTEKWLCKIPFFQKLLEHESIDEIVDSLTGLIARPHILAYAQNLVKEGVPFTFAILDLDNFKTINDTYGHKAGDDVLAGVANDLINFIGEDGVAGRFGGDEFLIVHLGILTYDGKKKFYDELFRSRKVLQKYFPLGENSPFITGTLGSATFPDDAQTYDDLFALTDKTLYRGKTKGRNCYIIYVEKKHKNIDIRELASHTLYSTFRDMAKAYDSTPDIYEKIRRIFHLLRDVLWITDFYYVNADREMKSIESFRRIGKVEDIDKLVTDELFSTNDMDEIRKICPETYQVLVDREIESFVVVRVGMGQLTFGYIMCAEPHSHRIWQDDEFAILFSLSRMLAGQIRAESITLE